MSAASIGGTIARAVGLAISLSGTGWAAARMPSRVVVLAPSAAEIVAELGLADRLVGVCGQCDYPPAGLAGLPKVGSYLAPSVEAILGMSPDLVLAVPSPGNREAVGQIERLGIEVLVVQDRSLADLWHAVRRIARRFGVRAQGDQLVGRIRAGLAAVRASVAEQPRPTVVLVVGHRPLVVAGAGTLQDELIDVAGGRNVGRLLGESWPTMSLETLARDAPAIVIDAAMGSEAGMRSLLPSTEDGRRGPRVVRVPIDTMVRAGPRVVDAARRLARELHPEGLK